MTAAFDPSHRGWIYADNAAGVSGTLSLSTDFGVTWTAKASPPTTFSGMQYLAVDPDQPNTLAAGTPDGLYKSTDGAASWTRVAPSGGIASFSPQTFDPFAPVSHSCSPTGGLFALGNGSSFVGSYQVAFSPDYGTTWGQPQLTHLNSVAVGPGCAVYITRQASSDAFVAKVTPEGQTLWATYLGGSDQDAPAGLAVDTQGNAYVTGTTTSPDFPVNVPRIGVAGRNSVFAVMLSPEGKLLYSVLVGGEANNSATAITVDARQNAYLVGSTNSQSFPVTPGTLATQIIAGAYTGFLVKIGPGGSLVYATYLRETTTIGQAILVGPDEGPVIAGTGLAMALGTPRPLFVVKLDPAASQIVSTAHLENVIPVGPGPTALATDAGGNLFVAGTAAAAGFPLTPGSYVSPPSLSGCTSLSYLGGSNAFVIKLAGADWTPVYGALLTAPCGIQTGAIAVDATGAVSLALATGNGLPLHNPLLGGNLASCPNNASAVARLSADGAALAFATYLDNCGIPGIAVDRDGSLFVGVSPSERLDAAGVLKLNTTSASAISLDQIMNAFSSDSSAVVGGGLYSLAVPGLQAPTTYLGLAPSRDLPTQLGGVQVAFDGVLAPILATGPGRVMVAAPANPPGSSRANHGKGFTAIQVLYGGAASNLLRMPVSAWRPGLMTADYPNLPPYSSATFPDGVVYNQDGTRNDANHPAAAGSMITVYGTGLGATKPAVNPGSIARNDAVTPTTPAYSSWKYGTGLNPVAETVASLPGFVSALFQIHIQVPASIQGLPGAPLDNGVLQARLWLVLNLLVSPTGAQTSNVVGVYVK